MIETMHLAAQYLAAAGISFLPTKKDDSHTNVSWDVHLNSLLTDSLNQKDLRLALNYKTFALDILQEMEVEASFPLKGKPHTEVLNWLKEEFKSCGIIKEYKYVFHYKLPYKNISKQFIWDFEEQRWLDDLISLNNLAQMGLSYETQNHNGSSSIRIWPHHFDFGAMITFEDTNKTIGLGMAIPDSMIDDFYFYVYAWDGKKSLSTEGIDDLSIGRWIDSSWKGAILEASNISHEEVELFLKESVHQMMLKLGVWKPAKMIE